ncbi:NADPH-dependent F420 reductase [Arthrobacter sp. NPDC092385]|uniref:NADPH-dependent F420 reductase n=1 Tax=Arthrobacter sp. NPDC092385 TaxID=3363943 RepID=UPI0037F7346C
MSTVTIIGSGRMARGIAIRMLHARCQVKILGRNGLQTRALVEELGPGVQGGFPGEPIEGHVVVLAVPYADVKEVILEYGSGLDGKIVVDISNPVDVAGFDRLLTPPGISSGEQTAELLGGGADVVKAFNTVFAATLHEGRVAGEPLDVFLAGDSEDAKAAVGRLVAASGMRPVDVGPLRRARELEATMLLVMGLQVGDAHPHFNWNTALKILP